MRSSLALTVCAWLAVASCVDDDPVQRETSSARGFDPRLSRRGVYADLRTRAPSLDAIEYRPDYELWSDGSTKRRWLILPAGARIDTANMDHWQFPVGTKLVKEFSRDGRTIETRIIERIANAGEIGEQFFMGAFVWSEDGSEAFYSEDGVTNALGTTHDVPMQDVCKQCHAGEPGAVLGFSALQLSRSGMLTSIAQRGLLTVDPQRTFVLSGSDTELSAVGALHANCGHCHAESGMGSLMRMQVLASEVDRPLADTQLYRTLIGQAITDWTPRPPQFALRVAAGDPERSALFYRMGLRSGNGFTMDQMPPLATEQRNEEMISVVRAWISSLAPPAPVDAGAPPVDAGDTTRQDAGALPMRDAGGALDASVSLDASVASASDAQLLDAALASDG